MSLLSRHTRHKTGMSCVYNLLPNDSGKHAHLHRKKIQQVIKSMELDGRCVYYSFNSSIHFNIFRSLGETLHHPISHLKLLPSSQLCFSAKQFKRLVSTQCCPLLSCCSLMNPLSSGLHPVETCRGLAPDAVNNDLHVVKSKVTSQFSSSATPQQFLTQPINPFSKESSLVSRDIHFFPGVSCRLTGYSLVSFPSSSSLDNF